MFLRLAKNFSLVLRIIVILVLFVPYDDAGVVLRDFKTRRMIMEELAEEKSEEKDRLKSSSLAAQDSFKDKSKFSTVSAPYNNSNHTNSIQIKKSKTIKRKNGPRSSAHIQTKKAKREPRAKQVYNSKILEILDKNEAKTFNATKSSTQNSSTSFDSGDAKSNKTKPKNIKSYAEYSESSSTNQSIAALLTAVNLSQTFIKPEQDELKTGVNNTTDLISANKELEKKQTVERNNFHKETTNLTIEENTDITDLKADNQSEFIKIDKFQDTIDKNDSESYNSTDIFLFPVSVPEFKEDEELANLSTNTIVENIIDVNHVFSKTNQISLEPAKPEIEPVKSEIEPIKSKIQEKRKKVPNKRRKSSPKKSKDTKFKSLGMKLSENISGDGLIHLEPVPDKNEGLNKPDIKNISEFKSAEKDVSDFNRTHLNNTVLGFESVVSSGIDFLMNTEVAKNAAMAMEVFNLSDPSLADHIIEDSDLHSFIDVIMPSSQEMPETVSNRNDAVNVENEILKHSNISNASGTLNDSRIAQVQVKPFINKATSTIGLDITVNVTGLSSGKECPPPGLCLLWFAAHDHCDDDGDCSDEMMCCQVRCTKECIEV